MTAWHNECADCKPCNIVKCDMAAYQQWHLLQRNNKLNLHSPPTHPTVAEVRLALLL